jgi:diguanylate cyclase (GGDEF)-like protein
MSQSKQSLPQVLVIDDDETIHLWAKRHLTKAGFSLISALNGKEGLTLFEKNDPEIVLVDIDMPLLDGFGTCSVIRQLPQGKNTPLLIMTGTEDAERIAKSYSSGATDFVVKPINWKVLIHRLQYMVKASQILTKLTKSEMRLSKAQQMAKLGHWEWNNCSEHLFWSTEIYEIFEVNPAQFIPDLQGFLRMVNVADKPFIESSLNQVLTDKEPKNIEYQIITGKNKHRFLTQQIEILEDQHHQTIGLAGTIQDITQRKEQEIQIRQLAYYDEVTGLPNRTYFLELLEKTIATCKANNQGFVLMFMDLDGFKSINDTYGHHTGDQLLRMAADRLACLLRDTVTPNQNPDQAFPADIARLGGDEFTVILNITQRQDAVRIAEQLIATMAKPIVISNQTIFVAASIGIAFYPDDGTDSETLLKNADIAMYHTKKINKGSYQFFHSSLNIQAKKRQDMEGQMHQAIANNELRLFYQPIIDAESGNLIGAEALMRWDSKQLGFLMPSEFIPLAEENGLIVKLGEWAIREVCRQHKEWRQQDMGHLSIAVNLSSIQFSQSTFIPMVKSILAEYQIKPDFLVFELTESTIMKDTDKMLTILWQLKEIGIKLSIDDFGTGYSSLSYLKNFPLDSLKIDRSFVKDLPENVNDGAIVQAILSLASTLSLNTIAEGVETSQQKQFFQDSSCKSIQGFLFSEPMPVADFKKYWQTKENMTLP